MMIARIALLTLAIGARVAMACQPAPTFMSRSPGTAYLLATASSASASASGVRVDVLSGQTLAGRMAPGPAILVPWAFGKDCKPIVWAASRVWTIPRTAALYRATPRPRDRWISGVPTFDVYMAELEPIWSDRPRRFSSTSADSLLTPADAFAFHAILPTDAELEGKDRRAWARLTAWESAHPSLAARQPAYSALMYFRWYWRTGN